MKQHDSDDTVEDFCRNGFIMPQSNDIATMDSRINNGRESGNVLNLNCRKWLERSPSTSRTGAVLSQSHEPTSGNVIRSMNKMYAMQNQVTDIEGKRIKDTASATLQPLPETIVTLSQNAIAKQSAQGVTPISAAETNTILTQSNDALGNEFRAEDVTISTDNSNAAGNPGRYVDCDRFTFFLSLPTELRLAIWRLSFPGRRYVEIRTTPGYYYNEENAEPE